MEHLRKTDPETARAIADKLNRQKRKIELIASENFVSRAVLEAQGSVLTNKYAEGYPGRRYYGGCEYVDIVEEIARERAKKLFGAEHANVQPHSGAQANMAVYLCRPESRRHGAGHEPGPRRPPDPREPGEFFRKPVQLRRVRRRCRDRADRLRRGSPPGGLRA